jgi:hypothetical protein
MNNGVPSGVPDTIVAKSPTRVIEGVNSAVRLFDTSGNMIDTRDLNSFFGAPLLGTPQQDFGGRLFDPKVYNDRNATNPRVYVVALQFSGRGNAILTDNISRMWVAVSRSPDPANLTTDWCRYIIDSRSEIDTTDESWADRPGIGAGEDSFSISVNNFRFSDDAFRFTRIHVFDKNIASNNAAFCPIIPRFIFQPSSLPNNFGVFEIQPAQHYTSPSSGTFTTNPAYYISTTFGPSDLYHIHRVRNVAGGSPNYDRVTLINTPYDIPPDGTQPMTTMRIDSGDNRVLQVAGVGNTIIGTFTTFCQFTLGTMNESCTMTPRVDVGFSALGDLTAAILENTLTGFGDDIFVHHNSIATDDSLRFAANWQFNGTGRGGFFHSSAAMFKPGPNAGWQRLQDYAPGNCAYTPPPRPGTTGAPVGDYSGAQLDPTLIGFWLAGERAETIDGTCQWGTRIAQVNP